MALEQNAKRISPAQRAALFAQATRQNIQPLPAIAGAEDSTVSFNLHKVRLTSKLRLMVTATLTATHATETSYTPAAFAPWTLLRRVVVEINNGFGPYNLSGRELYFYNLTRGDAGTLARQTSGRGRCVQGLTASSSGTANTVRFVVDLPFTLNDRDPMGLLLTQNQETVVSCQVDIANAAAIAPASTGYTFALSNIVITPIVETFSIPITPDAFPDLSILKLVHSKREAIDGAGVVTVSLPVGNTYRKLIVFVEDASGGVADSDISGNMELVFNEADIPYRIPPAALAAINQEQFDTTLPQGLYVFDFSYQGLANYGGARDYIDTERLTEFWLRFTAANAGNVTVVYETLSRLRSM